MENDNKQIFEPGDFKPPYRVLIPLEAGKSEVIAAIANHKLASLGIDAETLAESGRGELFQALKVARERLAELEIQLKNREWYIDKIEPRLKELESELAQAKLGAEVWCNKAQKLERMIAEAPVVKSWNFRDGLVSWYIDKSTVKYSHRARLVQIEPIGEGECSK